MLLDHLMQVLVEFDGAFYIAFEHLKTGPKGQKSIEVIFRLPIWHVHVHSFHACAIASFTLIVQVETHVLFDRIVMTIESMQKSLVAH